MCPPMWAHWRYLANVIELVLPPTHNPNGKSISSAVFAQLTAECLRVLRRHLANVIEIVYIGAM